MHVLQRERVIVEEGDQACASWNVVNDRTSVPSSMPSLVGDSESGDGEIEPERQEEAVTGLACLPSRTCPHGFQCDRTDEAIHRAWVLLHNVHLQDALPFYDV